MPLPDYQGGSLVNLMASLIASLGGEAPIYPPLRELPPAYLGRRTILLLVIDGLGYDYLTRSGRGGTLHRHLKTKITSVFPSTTASAITTLLTGDAPQQHALTGWHMYFKELGCVMAVLPLHPRYGGRSSGATGIDVGTLFNHVPVFDRIGTRSYVVAPERIVNSEFNAAHTGRAERRGYVTLKQFFKMVAKVVRENGERKYIYAYWPEFDRLAHDHGVASREVAAHFAELDAAFAGFLKRIAGSDTTVIVTADHGFIDTDLDHTIELEAHPDLADMLMLPLCGERRVAYCYVQPDKFEAFADYVGTHLTEYADLYPSVALIENGYFGLGTPHPRLLERIGHYTLIMKRNAVIKDWLPGERRYVHVGVHGGVSDEEMYIPLVVAVP